METIAQRKGAPNAYYWYEYCSCEALVPNSGINGSILEERLVDRRLGVVKLYKAHAAFFR